MVDVNLDLGTGAEDLGTDAGTDAGTDELGTGAEDLGTDDLGAEGAEKSVPESELKRRLAREKKKHDAEVAKLKAENLKELKKAKMTQAQKEEFDVSESKRLLEEERDELKRDKLTYRTERSLEKVGLTPELKDLLVLTGDEESIEFWVGVLGDAVKESSEKMSDAIVKSKISQPEPGVERKGNLGGSRTSRSDIFKK